MERACVIIRHGKARAARRTQDEHSPPGEARPEQCLRPATAAPCGVAVPQAPRQVAALQQVQAATRHRRHARPELHVCSCEVARTRVYAQRPRAWLNSWNQGSWSSGRTGDDRFALVRWTRRTSTCTTITHSPEPTPSRSDTVPSSKPASHPAVHGAHPCPPDPVLGCGSPGGGAGAGRACGLRGAGYGAGRAARRVGARASAPELFLGRYDDDARVPGH